MANKYPEYKGLNLPNVAKKVLDKWEAEKIFEKSISQKEGNPAFVFTEGPPSANGLPGIHHVMARTIKDIFCRYKTLAGFQVKRKAGWDTHGLPVELKVEKELGITKEDIGKKISVDDYNKACREAVMRYTDEWEKLTTQMGYWVDMDDPYITYDPKYMESVWWLLGQIYDKGLMYKGYTIQPYSPKAGTGLSSHEINQPGCYRDVKDTTCVAQFKVKAGESVPFSNAKIDQLYILAWTTTPWTLPSNTALTVGPKIEYVLVQTWNQYTHEPIQVILAKNLVSKQFGKKFELAEDANTMSYNQGDKKIPYAIVGECLGSDLVGIHYEQLLDYVQPYENADQAFRVIPGDFVTTEDGTGIVHTAPTFGADDAQVAKEAGVPGMLILDENGNPVPLVDLQGRFRKELADPVFGLGGEYVKAEYLEEGEEEVELAKQRELLKDIIADLKSYLSVDERITLKLKIENKAFNIEKYTHSYPHCWRTDKPVLYYPLDSWFIKVTENREKLVELNKKINWKPKSTGEGRFGNWLETANDWNLSRSRYWGIPIPVWTSEDKTEQICISSVEQLKAEVDKAVAAGLMDKNPWADFVPGDYSKENYAKIDLHKNYVDEMILVSPTGQPMKREADLIDVWFDSGSAPFAQQHYPFENKELIDNGVEAWKNGTAPKGPSAFPTDYIAEGVDQTRGWFYTQHVIAALVFDTVSYKNVISNGLVLDKNGQKMSKRLGNAVDPFETLGTYGADPTRWYMITNAQPWDNLKFDEEGIVEVQRKFFGTLYNTYSFFSLYANIDEFSYAEADIDYAKRPEMDRWILSKLNTMIKEVHAAYEDYEPTKAGRLIQAFVSDELSNWYVRLCRRRFWKGDYSEDKISAYQTLYQCLETVAVLGSPIAPFYMDQLFTDLNSVCNRHNAESVHLVDFPKSDAAQIDEDLEEKMDIAQKVSSMVLSLRKREQIKVRQPLQKIMVPILDKDFARRLEDVKDIILSEVNIKEIELLEDTEGVINKKIKPNFKSIGPKYGKQMKQIAAMVNGWGSDDISNVEANNGWKGDLDGEAIELDMDDFEITTDDIPGWLVASEGRITVALDITLSDELKSEGIARELVNRIQNYRKDSGLEVMDRIKLTFDANDVVKSAIENNADYIKSEVLALDIQFGSLNDNDGVLADLEEGDTRIGLVKG
ncbi:isoleucine--tRNA ligase [Paracrocinitomix mangrovi]|uniref:isoleucine--tRNA ligase n=1 Tax=Paracrocinitomix mangrovi TaxID=2862509 RepID=UPI001C8E2C90|nr:isoleucine--tRNA ligase [Paracrocinitomix mangrovi]UKN00705.1 isoleucine--tRNA ligase [Paracrocinitomix mangrovi]